MASVKARVKAIGEAVKKNQFDDAIEQIHDLFKKDPNNYLGYELHRLLHPSLGLADTTT